MIDTNVIISAALFPNDRIKRFLSALSTEHNLLICSYSLQEAMQVTIRKYPRDLKFWQEFFRNLKYTITYTPEGDDIDKILGGISVRDKMDNPILASAIFADADILVTGDKDFAGLPVERPEIMTINQFTEKYL
jgi:putative PIN family toxin of toxin-antitoxin system